MWQSDVLAKARCHSCHAVVHAYDLSLYLRDPSTPLAFGQQVIEYAACVHVQDRIKGRAVVISVIDNLVKGASGQAMQNLNLMLGYPETTALQQLAMFP
jgi:N-acetyl-gamma-glutamylphosphate reductase